MVKWRRLHDCLTMPHSQKIFADGAAYISRLALTVSAEFASSHSCWLLECSQGAPDGQTRNTTRKARVASRH